MDIKSKIRSWAASTIITFLLYELLWYLLSDDVSYPYESVGELVFDIVYCGLFALTSIAISRLLIHIPLLGRLTMLSQLLLCVTTLVFNIIVAFLFERGYGYLVAPDEVFFWQGFYLFSIIASLLTLLHTTSHYAIMAIRQREELTALQKRALQNQLNPHFVFNSLSSLAELIHSNPSQAEHYVICLSRAYRFVLSHLENDYASLSDSCAFIRNYVALQDVRYPGHISLQIDDFRATPNQFLFSMSLQLLVENAIKHNAPAEGEYLSISICREGDYVVVSNSVKHIPPSADSFGIGLESLCHRYRLERLPAPSFGIVGNRYVARMAIINKSNIK